MKKSNAARLTAVVLLSSAMSLWAQPAPTAPASIPMMPTAAVDSAPSQSSRETSVFGGGGFSTSDWIPWKQMGPVRFSSGVSYSHVWQERSPALDGVKRDTEVDELSGSLRFAYLDDFTLSYEPSWVNYTNKQFSDHIRHRFHLSTDMATNRLKFSFSQSYNRQEDSDTETGAQTLRESWRSQLTVSTSIARNTSLEYSASLSARSVPHVRMVRDWGNGMFIKYAFIRQGSLRVGYSKTISDVKPGPNADRDEISAQAKWSASTKINISARITRQTRKYNVTNAASSSSILYALEGNYRLGSKTTLGAQAEKSTSTSSASNTERERRSWSATATYILPINAIARAEYTRSNFGYKDIRNVLTRSDTTETKSLSVSAPLTRRIQASAFISWSKNESDFSRFEVDSSQYGLRVGYQF